ncbi:F-box protein FBW2-like [Curcuma longa]|uniref:F-box protein FBW2-like n=1 Tax=Curcuma longa TaxID=136217 RepID=UPI003D9EF6B2
MADGNEVRPWAELIPDALGLIFCNLPLKEILTVVPRVCKSWGMAVLGPYCWQEIDIHKWSKRCDPELLDQMLRMLIERSCGSFRRLSVYGLQTESMFTFIADHAGSLERLELPNSEISDSIAQLVAPRLSSLTYLDLSYCTRIGPRAIEAFGKHCRSLVVLRRRMYPLEEFARDDNCQEEEEAFAIAKMMTKLRHLEIPYQLATTRGVLEILSKCRDLEYLDLRGCWNVKLDEKYFMERHSGVKVLMPELVEGYHSLSSKFLWRPMSDDDEELSGGFFTATFTPEICLSP